MIVYIGVSLISVLLILGFIIIGKKVGYGVILEKLAIIWFRLACSFAILYIAHIIADGYNIIVPVNIFSALTITILGIPGMLCIGIITILQ
ncbi:pro-sigmaK processing inhibitor BofA family protein [Ureibacillus sp. MALMAid1270]|uniref:pro-sigmaK processing inhibitor BofA family protein n=1 Tax=Ureibacillus sp. MALMAid1270 TaxID=3411629 RepID=UPI003BA4BB05